MAWDSSRPVPWGRLVREWVVYAVIMVAVFLLFFRDAGAIGAIAGILVSGPLYLAVGYVLAKFGYQRARLQRPAPAATSSGTTTPSARPKPPPTKRTGGSSGRPGGPRR